MLNQNFEPTISYETVRTWWNGFKPKKSRSLTK